MTDKDKSESESEDERRQELYNDIAVKNSWMLIQAVKTSKGKPVDLAILLERIVAACLFTSFKGEHLRAAIESFKEDLSVLIKEMQDKENSN